MMKLILTLTAIVTLSFSSYAQQVVPIAKADSAGINLKSLDDAYPDAAKMVFSDQHEEYLMAYYSMLHEFSSFLNQNSFKWGRQIRCFNRIYFAEDGSIDYFLFNFKEGDLSKQQERSFNELLNKFTKTYKFTLTKGTKFAQCGPVSYRDPI